MKVHKYCRNLIWTLYVIIMLINGIGYETLHTDSAFCVAESAVQTFCSPHTLQKNEILLMAEQNSRKTQVLASEFFRGNKGQIQRRNQDAILIITLTVLSFLHIYMLTAYYRQKRERILKSMLIVQFIRRSDGKKELIGIYPT